MIAILKSRGWRPPAAAAADERRDRRAGAAELIHLEVVTAFTRTPGPRYRRQGEGSGEAFRDDHLLPKVRNAVDTGRVVAVDIGNVEYGCPIGWLEEVFGGARRVLGQIKATKHIQIRGGPRATPEIADAYQALTNPGTD